ncbi:putative spermidine/putrescine transport system substrate-binding protein [Micromonospora echinospora]|uniref:Putative spermidine/putrescine transport system substrate-binding protein n=1 Tax=Micromonospora echinospora TaxID=1877 RepID=A0A1C4Z2D9_MICEC|nr:ABC transporter substrate-binding protein [Micromonospora echinospora]SCF26741.1 putative spermidine/putrescine transport system substrate-binding protein [Micromonospora echinospora]
MRTYLDSTRSRRLVGAVLATVVVAVGSLTACSEAGGGEKGSITYAGFGGTYEEAVKAALFDPYSKETDVKVLYDSSGSDVAKLVQMSKSGSMNLDLIDAEDSSLAQFMAADILQPIDTKSLEGFADPSAVTEYSVPWYTFSRNLFWNKDEVPGGLDSWADLFDTKKIPGKRGLVALPWGILEGALIADGVPVDQLYPLDLDRAFAKLDTIRKDTVFFPSNGDLQNAISQGEIALGYGNLARIKSIAESGAVPLDYTWKGAVLSVQQLVIPKGAPDQPDAFEAIKYSLKPEVQTAMMEKLGYTPSLKSVLDGLDAETRADLPGTQETASDETFRIDVDWWAKNGADVLKRWQDWQNA